MEFGKVEFKEGIYQGEVENGMANGYGLIKFFNGDIYIGEMKNNHMTGIGAKSTASYITLGNFESGKRQGHCCTVEKRKIITGIYGYYGIFIPEYYIGNYSNDVKSGYGTYLYRNDDAYDGNFQNNLPNGKGAYSHHSNAPDGDGYFAEGNFINGKLVGTYTQYAWTKFSYGDIFHGKTLPDRERWYYGYGEWIDKGYNRERRIGYHNIKGRNNFEGTKIFENNDHGNKRSIEAGNYGNFVIGKSGKFSKIYMDLGMYIGNYSTSKKDGEGISCNVDRNGNIEELYVGHYYLGKRTGNSVRMTANGYWGRRSARKLVYIATDGCVYSEEQRVHPDTRPYKNFKDYEKNRKPDIIVNVRICEALPVYQGILNAGGFEPQNVQQTRSVRTPQQITNENQPATNNNQTESNTQISTVTNDAPVKPTPPSPPPKKEFEIDGETLVEYNGKDDYVVVPENVTKIGENAFDNAKKFLKRVAFYDTLTEIGKNAFADCTKLERVDLSASLTTIDSGAFKNCTSIKNISYLNKGFPESLSYIGNDAFFGCKNLTKITLPGGCECDNSAFPKECRVWKKESLNLDTDDGIKPKAFKEYLGNDEHVVIPKGTNSIWVEAFYGVKNILKSVVIPEGVTSIFGETFEGFEKLEKVVLPSTLTYIHHDAFKNCKNLEDINFPDGLVFIGERAFIGCEKLKYIKLPDTCKYEYEDEGNLSFSKNCKIELFKFKSSDKQSKVEEKEFKDKDEVKKEPIFKIENGVLIKYTGSKNIIDVPSEVKQILPNAFVDAKEFLE